MTGILLNAGHHTNQTNQTNLALSHISKDGERNSQEFQLARILANSATNQPTRGGALVHMAHCVVAVEAVALSSSVGATASCRWLLNAVGGPDRFARQRHVGGSVDFETMISR